MKTALLFSLGILLSIILLGCGEAGYREPGAQSLRENGLDPKNEELLFTILHTNDEHSALIPHSPAIDYLPHADDLTAGGSARLASAVEGIRREKREEGEPVLLFSAGDFIGGSAFSWLAQQGLAPELDVMQTIGYDAVIIGNHEFDYGPDVLAAYLQAAGYPEAHHKTLLLAANTKAPYGIRMAAIMITLA